jgi:curli production assembly/transport component CsgF
LLSELISSGEPGSLETDDYTLTITDNDGFLTITVIDKSTGESTTIEVTGL